MGKLIFIRFVLMALVLHTAQTDIVKVHVLKGEPIRLEVLPHGSVMDNNSALLVKRKDMTGSLYVYRESDGHVDDHCQHQDYKNRTSLENRQIFNILSATITDSGTYTIAVIPNEESGEESDRDRLKTPPSMIYQVLVTEQETVQNKDNSKDNNKDNSKDNSKDNNKDNNKDNSKDNNKDNKNLWLTIGLLLGGFIVVLAAVALGLFFYKPLKELCCVYFCQCLSKRESESIISL